MLPGNAVVRMLNEAETKGLRSVYLRHWEALPDDIGNDVDILVERGATKQWVEFLRVAAPACGWRVSRVEQHSCLCVFLRSESPDETRPEFHVDLNEYVEWHCFAFANPAHVFARRVKGPLVYVPAVEDELYMNVMTRLLYQGIVREKHREQWRRRISETSIDWMRDVAVNHFGDAAVAEVFSLAAQEKWDQAVLLKSQLRRVLLRRAFFHPRSSLARVFALAGRVLTRPFALIFRRLRHS